MRTMTESRRVSDLTRVPSRSTQRGIPKTSGSSRRDAVVADDMESIARSVTMFVMESMLDFSRVCGTRPIEAYHRL